MDENIYAACCFAIEWAWSGKDMRALQGWTSLQDAFPWRHGAGGMVNHGGRRVDSQLTQLFDCALNPHPACMHTSSSCPQGFCMEDILHCLGDVSRSCRC
eukprot:1161050-Pelagomonas_calceolata.AAC.3